MIGTASPFSIACICAAESSIVVSFTATSLWTQGRRLGPSSCGIALIVFEKAPEPFMTVYGAFARCLMVVHRQEEHIASALMIPLVMIVGHVSTQGMQQRRFPKQDDL